MPGETTAPTSADTHTSHTTDIAELTAKLAESQQLLTQAREALDASERERQIERELITEGAIDIETASLLTETAVAGLKQADLRAAVSDLKRKKPFLFRTAPSKPAAAMSGHASPGDPLASAADQARESGDRRALLSYLRLRRSA